MNAYGSLLHAGYIPVPLMCGRYVSPDQAAVERAWHVGRHNNEPFVRRFNVAPTAIVPVLRLDRHTGMLELAAARWGLIPYWWKDRRAPNFAFNARIEEAASKPLWRDALRRARCLIPAEGWYEWQERDTPPPGTGPRRRPKQPYFIRRRDGRLLCFAGLLACWTNPDTREPVLSCAILTMAATGTLAALHERMPVVAADASHGAWLDPDATDGAEAAALITAAGNDDMEHHPVGMRVNDARTDGPELIEPAGA